MTEDTSKLRRMVQCPITSKIWNLKCTCVYAMPGKYVTSVTEGHRVLSLNEGCFSAISVHSGASPNAIEFLMFMEVVRRGR